ncbi:histone deacetylase [candidate division KSB1 bacterium]|nr:histone deacetylase [candidate division KSB1 bacterium]
MESGSQHLQSNKTGWVYDPLFLDHYKPGHPERPERLRAVHNALIQTGMDEQLVRVPTRPATEDELQLVHHSDYIRTVRDTAEKGGGQLDPDTYVNTHSYQAAIRAVGGLIDLSKAVYQGELQNGFALVRPPGHHALPDRAMGFCLFNNVALAAKALLQEKDIDRIAIVDFDVHHGNGTQAAFDSDPSVLYISTHQMPHYPGTGSWEESGLGEAKGSIVNIPLSCGMGDKAILKCYESIVLPKLEIYRPQMILVSEGYDAHWHDPLAGLMLSSMGQARLSALLIETASSLCGGRIVFTLEGGYDLDVMQQGVVNTIRALLGCDDFTDSLGSAPHDLPMDEGLLEKIRKLHSLE